MFWLFPLRNWDEAWYAEIIKNMASGHYSLLVPFWNGQYFFDKTPLYFWLSLPVVWLFGIGEWQVRIVSLLAFIGSILLIYLLGKKLFNKTVGIFSAVVFVSLGQVFVRLSHGNLDGLLIFLGLLTFYFYLFSEKSKLFALLAGISLGFGFLVKGWAIGLYPLFTIFLYSLIVQKKFIKNFWIIVLAAVVSSSWYYVLGYITFGKQFLDWYVFTIAEGDFGQIERNFSLDYTKYFIRDIGIWILLIVLYLIKVREVGNKLIFLALNAAAFIFAINFLNEKLDWHTLPAYPYIALVIGYSIFKLIEHKGRGIYILIVLLLVAQIYVVYKIENIYPDRSNVGANLGIYTKGVIKPGDTVLFDDHDFTSFLYYSDHKKVFITTKEKIKPREWWTVDSGQVINFTKDHKPTLIISRDLSGLVKNYNQKQVVDCYKDYCFLRYE